MRHQLRSVITLCAASVTLSACSDRPTSATAPAVRVPSAVSATFSTLTCDITALKADARDFASSGNDPLFKIIGDLKTATDPTDKAFDGLARMAAIRGTGAQRSGVKGAVFDDLVHRFLGCANPAVTANAIEQNFGAALGPGWMFEVRGKATGPYADPSGGAYERGSTTANWWAAEVKAGQSWADAITSSVTNDRVLIYGFETGFLNVSGRFGGSSFENRTIPGIAAGSFGLTVNIGLCLADASSKTGSERLNHNNNFVELISNLKCDTPTGFTTTASLAFGSMNPVRLAQRALGFLAPQPAYAAFVVGSVGGAVSELSPSAVYNLDSLFLDKLGTIADGTNSVPLFTTQSVPVYGTAVVIRARDKDGTPIEGVPIQVSIAGNSSSIAFFSVNGGPSLVTVTDTTDAAGYANFGNVSLTKAGGYTLNFRVNFNGVTGPVTPSNSFNIQNK